MALTAAEKQKRYRERKSNAPDKLTVTPEGSQAEVPANYGQSDCACQHCQNVRAVGKDPAVRLNHGPYKRVDELADDRINRVSLPGDVDYVGVAI